MFNPSATTFLLDNFEGPLELLLYLIQKEEIDICSIHLKNLTEQFVKAIEAAPEVDSSSETLTLAATLLLIKSQRLLPKECQTQEMEDDARVEMIQSLIEYCRFKEAAKMLSLREEEQKALFPRATPPFQKEISTGLDEIGIDNLKNLLFNLIEKSLTSPKQIIKEEQWQVNSKLEEIGQLLSKGEKICFEKLFSLSKTRNELIVLFLALLELMKHQEAKIVRENESIYIVAYDTRT